MRRISESLAGRASYLTLWPMTRREQCGVGRCGRWEELLETEDGAWVDLLRAERTVWFEDDARTYVEGDLRTLSSISALTDFRRLMRAACLRLGQLLNQTELARDLGLPQPTVRRYLYLLETSFLLLRIPAYAVNRTRRLTKTSKLYWGDVGLAAHLAGVSEPGGAHLENIVLSDLLCWRDARAEPAG